jgi:O-antigen/teichoic acid export membrane protein
VLASDNILIAWILGPAAVVPFFLTQQMAVLAQSHLRGIGQATWAGLAELYSHGNEATFRVRLLELTGMVSGLGMAILAPITAYNASFVGIWVGRNVYAGDAVTALGCLNALLWSVFSLWGWVLLGAGRIGQWVRFGVASALLSVAVSISATAAFGVIGPLVGSAAGLLLVTSWALPRVVHTAFNISPWKLWRAALTPFCWGLPYAVTLCVIAGYMQPRGLLQLVASLGLSAAIGLMLWWRFSLGSRERSEWRSRIRSVFLWG